MCPECAPSPWVCSYHLLLLQEATARSETYKLRWEEGIFQKLFLDKASPHELILPNPYELIPYELILLDEEFPWIRPIC